MQLKLDSSTSLVFLVQDLTKMCGPRLPMLVCCCGPQTYQAWCICVVQDLPSLCVSCVNRFPRWVLCVLPSLVFLVHTDIVFVGPRHKLGCVCVVHTDLPSLVCLGDYTSLCFVVQKYQACVYLWVQDLPSLCVSVVNDQDVPSLCFWTPVTQA